MNDTAYDRMIQADKRLVESIKRNDLSIKIRHYEKRLEEAREEWQISERIEAEVTNG